jgi:hypothetical protein
MKEVVIAGYNKPLDWIKDFNSDVKLTIYRKGESISYENEIYIHDNVGRDVHTFFNHIYQNYENLSEYTFFVQDYPFDHWENLIEVINGDLENFINKSTLNFDGYFGFHYNTIGTMWQMYPSSHFKHGKIISCSSNGQPQDSDNNVDVDSYWDILFENPKPKMYEFVPGGHFGVSKSQVHIRSKKFYSKIVELLENDQRAPWRIERLEGYIFCPEYKTKF